MYRPRVTSPFGMRIHPIEKVPKHHDGVDLVSSTNRIYNITPFTLTLKAQTNTPKGGNCITLAAPGKLEFTLRHLPEGFKANKQYQPGAFISMAGNTGGSTAPHLHLEVRQAGKLLDPSIFFKEPGNIHWGYQYLPENADRHLDNFNFDAPMTRAEFFRMRLLK